MKKMIVVLALLFVANAAWAFPTNVRQYTDFGTSSDNPPTTLQNVLDSHLTNGSISVIGDQSTAALWNKAGDSVSTEYLIANIAGSPGLLGIYNTTGDYVPLTGILPGMSPAAQAIFNVTDQGVLYINNNLSTTWNNFGTFGFYWQRTPYDGARFHTEDWKNNQGETRALTYLLDEGTKVTVNNPFPLHGTTTATADGKFDWIIAFENGVNALGTTDKDFQDAVWYVSEISAVPEPGTILLLGGGLLGLGFYGRRRMKA